jgi:hypothetical protein
LYSVCPHFKRMMTSSLILQKTTVRYPIHIFPKLGVL